MGKQHFFQGMTGEHDRIVGFAWGETLGELRGDVKVLKRHGYGTYGRPFLGGTNK